MIAYENDGSDNIDYESCLKVFPNSIALAFTSLYSFSKYLQDNYGKRLEEFSQYQGSVGDEFTKDLYYLSYMTWKNPSDANRSVYYFSFTDENKNIYVFCKDFLKEKRMNPETRIKTDEFKTSKMSKLSYGEKLIIRFNIAKHSEYKMKDSGGMCKQNRIKILNMWNPTEYRKHKLDMLNKIEDL
jgi:hypothetical protein